MNRIARIALPLALVAITGCAGPAKTGSTDGGKGDLRQGGSTVDMRGSGGNGKADMSGGKVDMAGGGGSTDDLTMQGGAPDLSMTGGSTDDLTMAGTVEDLSAIATDDALAPGIDCGLPCATPTPDLSGPAASDGPASGGGDGGGACIQIATWPGLAPEAGFDSTNMVTFTDSADQPGMSVNALSVEDWHAAGAMYPKMVTYSSADTYAKCDVCTLILTCTAAGCKQTYFAQGGTVSVTRADQDPNTGRMTATATNLKLVEWDFSQTGDKPKAGGNCYVIGQASWDVTWGGTPDGGAASGDAGPVTTPDGGAVADMTILPAGPDLSAPRPDGPMGCNPVVNELQTGGTKASDEFVELYNPCASDIDLTGWRLVYRSSGNNSKATNADTLLLKPTLTIKAGGYLVIGGSGYTGAVDARFASGGLSGTGGAVGLRDPFAFLVDSVSYDVLSTANNLTETASAPNPPAGSSIARTPNGADTGDNSMDFQITATPTPGAAN